MTPESEAKLLADVAVTKDNVADIKASMVTHDQCEAMREGDRRTTSNGALTTYRERTWRLTTIVVAIGLTGFVTWLLNH